MKNDELKALYEEFPWAWEAQRQSNLSQAWGTDHVSTFGRAFNWRLKPRLPADLPEPTEDMMNRAVYLGKGPIETRGKRFSGFMGSIGGAWYKQQCNGQHPQAYYCIDINDPDAREIIALNHAHTESGRLRHE